MTELRTKGEGGATLPNCIPKQKVQMSGGEAWRESMQLVPVSLVDLLGSYFLELSFLVSARSFSEKMPTGTGFPASSSSTWAAGTGVCTGIGIMSHGKTNTWSRGPVPGTSLHFLQINNA